MGVPTWMAHARGELTAGVREVAGTGSNQRIVKYWREAKIEDRVTSDDVPWCAAFVGAMLARAGLDPSLKANAKSYLKWGREVVVPYEGCIAVLDRGTASWQGHVAFYVKSDEANSRILLLGGNQSDRVGLNWYPEDRVICYREPITETADEVEKRLVDNGSRTLVAAKNVETAAASVVIGTPVALQVIDTTAKLIEPYVKAAETAESTVGGVTKMTGFALQNWWIVAALVGAIIINQAWKISAARIDDALTGVHTGRKTKEDENA